VEPCGTAAPRTRWRCACRGFFVFLLLRDAGETSESTFLQGGHPPSTPPFLESSQGASPPAPPGQRPLLCSLGTQTRYPRDSVLFFVRWGHSPRHPRISGLSFVHRGASPPTPPGQQPLLCSSGGFVPDTPGSAAPPLFIGGFVPDTPGSAAPPLFAGGFAPMQKITAFLQMNLRFGRKYLRPNPAKPIPRRKHLRRHFPTALPVSHPCSGCRGPCPLPGL